MANERQRGPIMDEDWRRRMQDEGAANENAILHERAVRTMMINEISWGAVLAGVALAIVTQIFINMLGVGIGAATLSPTGDNPSAATFSMSAGIWFAVSGILASMAGGYAAGRLAGKPEKGTSGWHGLIAWAVTTVVVVYLLTSAIGGILGGTFSVMSGLVSAGARTAQSTLVQPLASAADPFSGIEQSIRGNVGSSDPAALTGAAVASTRAAITATGANADAARDQAAQAIARAQGIPVEQARTQLTGYVQQYEETMAQAQRSAAEAAEVAAGAVTGAALAGAATLLLGALAGWFGGRMGVADIDSTEDNLASRSNYATHEPLPVRSSNPSVTARNVEQPESRRSAGRPRT
jgi:hypothetical protein